MNHLTIHKHRVSRIRHWASCGEIPTLAHFRHFSPLYTNEYRVSRYESFMQNKPNLRNAEMNVSEDYTEDYENKSDWTLGENKPNSNPKQSQSNPIRSQNKPNSKPIYPYRRGKQTQFQKVYLLRAGVFRLMLCFCVNSLASNWV